MTTKMSGTAYDQYIAVFDRIHAALTAAQTERDTRRGMVQTASGSEAEWIVFERDTVWRAVNAERTRRGPSPVPLSAPPPPR